MRKRLPTADPDPLLDASPPGAAWVATASTPPERPKLSRSERPSRTALKNQAAALQTLGQQLARMPQAKLEAAGVQDPLLTALVDLQKTKSHEGKRRQLQYVGKLMRQLDAAPLQQAAAQMQLGPARETLSLHQAETWRDAMVADDAVLARFVGAHPRADANGLRLAVARCRSEIETLDAQGNGPTRRTSMGQGARQGPAWRALFKLIRPFC
jgi:ribosome-associated protein